MSNRVRRSIRQKGQATTEMVIMIPILLSLIFGGLVIIYSCWQGIKVQQAANFLARMQGQERISGGVGPQEVTDANGVEMGMGGTSADPQAQSKSRPHGTSSLWARLDGEVRKMFVGVKADDIRVLPPTLGLNVDKVTVVRTLTLPKIPFLDLKDDQRELTLEGKAWGGEDTYMYGLPRWGKAGSGSSGPDWWRSQMKDNASKEHDE